MLRGTFSRMYAAADAGRLDRKTFRDVALLDEGICPSCMCALRRSKTDDAKVWTGSRAWVCTACGQVFGLYID